MTTDEIITQRNERLWKIQDVLDIPPQAFRTWSNERLEKLYNYILKNEKAQPTIKVNP